MATDFTPELPHGGLSCGTGERSAAASHGGGAGSGGAGGKERRKSGLAAIFLFSALSWYGIIQAYGRE